MVEADRKPVCRVVNTFDARQFGEQIPHPRQQRGIGDMDMRDLMVRDRERLLVGERGMIAEELQAVGSPGTIMWTCG